MTKRFKRLLAVILSLAIIFSTASALGITSFAQEDILKYLTYEINDGKVTITGCDSNISGDVVIPDTIEGYPVETIHCSFSNCSKITSMTIGNSDLILDSWGFHECTNLVSVTIGDGDVIVSEGWGFYGCTKLESITIGDGDVIISDGWGFYNCVNLKSITIGDGDVIISDGWGFYNCVNFESITVGDGALDIDYSMLVDTKFYENEENWVDGVLYIGNHLIKANENITDCTIREGTVSIGDNAFNNCNNLKSVTIPDSVVSIGDFAFANCYSLRGVTIPDNVICIGDCAFQNCSGIAKINISENIMSIGNNAFEGCSGLQSITVDENNLFYSSDDHGVLFNKDKTTLIQYPSGNIRIKYEIPDSVKTVGDSAFSYCNSLINVIIPDSVTHIGAYSFSNCESIENITIPEAVVRIGDNAFSWCSGLKSIVIPDSVIFVGDSAFAVCANLTSITIPHGLTDIGSYVFDGTGYYNDEKNWTDGLLYAGNCLVAAKGDISACKIKEGTTTICENAFYGYSALTNITIPDSVTSIGSCAFQYTGYYNNEENWTDGILYIGNYLIETNTEITTCNIKEGTVAICDNAFSNSYGIKRISIPSSLKFIGKSFDNGFNELISIFVDENNEYFSNDNFGVLFNKDKTELIRYPAGNERTVYEIPEGVLSIGDYAFASCSLADVVIPESVIYIGNSAFECSDGFLNITIPENVRSLGDSVFYSCSSLKTVVFENGNVIIGDNTFHACNSLEKVVFAQENTILGESAFNNCDRLENVIYGYGTSSICENAFTCCYELNNIFIPKTVTAIGSFAFIACAGLTDIYYGGSEADWEKVAVDCGNNKLNSVTIHFNSNPQDIPNETPTVPSEPTTTPNEPTIPNEPGTTPDNPVKPDKPSPDHELCPHENSGINITEHGVEFRPGMQPDDIRKNVKNDNVHIHSPHGEDLDDGSFVGTGCIIQVCDSDGNVLSEYEVIVASDINGDGKISAADARVALRTAARIDIINGVYVIAADVNGDGRITAADARVILRKSAGLDKDESKPQVAEADFERMADLLTYTFGTEFDYTTADTAYVVDYLIHDDLFILTYEYYFGEAINDGIFKDPLGKLAYHYKVPVENVKWICENVYQVEFDENYISSEGKSYYYDGYVYIEFAQAGYGCDFDTEIDEYKALDDGKYEIIASCYMLAYGYEEDGIPPELQCRLKVIAEWKQIDGKYDWVFYSIEVI